MAKEQEIEKLAILTGEKNEKPTQAGNRLPQDWKRLCVIWR